MQFACPNCGRMLEAPDNAAGMAGACKFCKASLIAPAFPGAAAQLTAPGAGTPPPASAPPPAGQPDYASPSIPGPTSSYTPPGYEGAPNYGATPGYAGTGVPPFNTYGVGATIAPPADVGLRFVALLIDGVILAVVRQVLNLVLIPLFGLGNVSQSTSRPGEFSPELLVRIATGGGILFFVSAAVQWAYYAFLESSPAQATFGKQALGLKVTDLDGNRLTFGKAGLRSFVRFFSGLFCAIGFIVAFFNPRKQALHDMAAGTLVVKP